MLAFGSRTFSAIDRAKATLGFENLISALNKVGLQTEVRNGDEQRLLVFVRAKDERVLGTTVYRSRYVRIGIMSEEVSLI